MRRNTGNEGKRVANFLQPRVKLEKTTFRTLSLPLFSFSRFVGRFFLPYVIALSDGLKPTFPT